MTLKRNQQNERNSRLYRKRDLLKSTDGLCDFILRSLDGQIINTVMIVILTMVIIIINNDNYTWFVCVSSDTQSTCPQDLLNITDWLL